MSTENKSAVGRIFGQIQRETNDTVVYISEQNRRIRYRYIATSQQYSSGAEYQCTQCPVTALMINAQFRIVDPSGGHECSVDGGRPQSKSYGESAATAVSAPQTAAATAPYSSSRPMKKAKKVIAEAVYDANNSIRWPSERYPGVTFTFRQNTSKPGRPRYFQCSACSVRINKYKSYLKACGISRRCLIVWDGNIVDFHPDDAGTNHGHLCQQPLLEEELRKAKALTKTATSAPDIAKVHGGVKEDVCSVRKASKNKLKNAKVLEKVAVQDAPNNVEIANSGNEDLVPTVQVNLLKRLQYAKDLPKLKVIGEPTTKSRNARDCSLAKRLSAESHEDKTFGKIRALSSSTLTAAESRVWSRAPDISRGPLQGKELIAYRSQAHKRRFKFILAGSSSLDEDAFDYFCMDCWNNHGEECRVTVRSSTQEFIITDPERTSSGRHACIQASSAGPSESLTVAKKPLFGLANTEADSLRNESVFLPVAQTSARSMEYFSERYQAKLKFTCTWHGGKKGQAYYVCPKCRFLQGKLKAVGYHRFGYTKIELFHAVVVAGRFVRRHPDECGVKLFVGDTVERRHICQDDKFKRLLDVDRMMREDRGKTSPKRSRNATRGPTSGRVVRTSIRTQSVDGSQAHKRLQNGSDPVPIDHPGGTQAEWSSPRDSAVDQVDRTVIPDTAKTTRNKGSTRQSDGHGPVVGPPGELLHFPESIDSISSSAQLATCSANQSCPFDDSDRTLNDQRTGVQADMARPRDSAVDQAISEQATLTRNNNASCRENEDDGLDSVAGVLDELLQLAESSYSVSSAARYATGSRAGTPLESEASALSATQVVVDGERKPRLFDRRRETTVMDDSNVPTPMTLKTNGTSRFTGCTARSGTRKRHGGLSVDVKPLPKKSPEVLTIVDSDDDTNINDTSSDTSSASQKRAKREPDENAYFERPQQGPRPAVDAQNAAVALVRIERDHLSVRYTPTSGMILKATHATALMTFRDFRRTFGIPQSTQQIFIFKANEEEWDVIRDDENTLPVINGHVEAKVYSEN